ncbi:MAG: T9SS type A sorting domain-containing protein [Chitinophagales bacterium]
MKPLFNLTLFISLIFFSNLNSQTSLNWQRALGGTGDDDFGDIIATSDGGYLAVGQHQNGINGDITVGKGNEDSWLVKLDANGNLVWEKTYGGLQYDGAAKALELPDGNFFIIGTAGDNTGDIVGSHGSSDAWLLKIDPSGNLIWQKCYGGTASDMGLTIIPSNDGNFILLCSAFSNNGDVVGKHGGTSTNDYWALKIDINGNIIWSRCYGGSKDEWPIDMVSRTGGGYFIVGQAHSLSGQVACNIDDESGSIWLVEIKENGGFKSSQCIGRGTGCLECGIYEWPYSMIETADGGFALSAVVDGIHVIEGFPEYHEATGDFGMIKFNAAGEVEWNAYYGATFADDICQTPDGGYLLAGSQDNTFADDDASGGYALGDYWLLKLSPIGLMEWEQSFGGNSYDRARGIVLNPDGTIVLGGDSRSTTGQVTGLHGTGFDWWILKTTPNVNMISCYYPLEGSDLCFGQDITIPYLATGTYIPGNVFTAQLSDLNGNFGAPVDIGAVASTTSGNILANIPATGIDEGFNYRLRVNSSTPAVTGFKSGDNLTVTCPIPVNLVRSMLTATSVFLQWDPTNCSEGYILEYKLTTDAIWTSVAVPSNSYLLTGLTPASSYNWRVRNECPGGNLSDVSIKKKFTTQVLRLADIGDNEVAVFPNPANGFITLVSSFKTAEFAIFSSTGALVRSGICLNGENLVGLEGISNGLYVIRVIADDEIRQLKLQVSR